jgi:hypothetical protein
VTRSKSTTEVADEPEFAAAVENPFFTTIS